MFLKFPKKLTITFRVPYYSKSLSSLFSDPAARLQSPNVVCRAIVEAESLNDQIKLSKYSPKMNITPPAQLRLLILASPDSAELSVLKGLPSEVVTIVGTGMTPEALSNLSAEDLASVNALLVCGVGAKAAKKDDIRTIFMQLPSLIWMHSASAGLEHLLFPELIDSPVVLTNAKSAYSHSLAEWALFGCNIFAKQLDRLAEQKRNRQWIQFEVEELRGRIMGIIGLGDIGSAVARMARAHGMKVLGLRRHPLTEEERRENLVDRVVAPDQICELMSESDYVCAATPWTPQTDKLVSRAAIAAMKPTAVFLNVGRGRCVDEDALIEALRDHKIRGAALDVFAVEPLPESSPLWDLPNVVISPHSADRTAQFQVDSLTVFVEIVREFLGTGQLRNVCDKKAGY